MLPGPMAKPSRDHPMPQTSVAVIANITIDEVAVPDQCADSSEKDKRVTNLVSKLRWFFSVFLNNSERLQLP